MGTRALGLAAVMLAAGACTIVRTECPDGTDIKRRIYSGGGEAEWCHRGDGVHQGPEARYYENGVAMIQGAYSDGAREGEWTYFTQLGAIWRRDRWEDGALVEQHVDPNMAPDPLAPTDSLVIKLASADPMLGRQVSGGDLEAFAVWYDDGKPRVLGHYDRDGLRTGTWRFWHPGGVLAREVDYDAGVRHRAFREWHANGRAKTDGSYDVGERDGRWRRWDNTGRLVTDGTYRRGKVAP
ncbi:MAG TPA: hypothetical protein VHJ20_20985 [Polyangia bacterium]|nr:hypothetical protein [Polyangia bacterium]